MPSRTCSVAFKEWAAVCEALAAGRQTIILRKGGIHEGRDGFRLEHRRFWLYPTHFHQAAESLSPDTTTFVDRALAGTKPGPAAPPLTSQVPIQLLADVVAVHELLDEEVALRLAGLHIYSEATVRQRFHYKRPGLFLLIARIYARPSPILVPESAEMAGCKSWVTLPESLATCDAAPVLADEPFQEQLAAIGAAMA